MYSNYHDVGKAISANGGIRDWISLRCHIGFVEAEPARQFRLLDCRQSIWAFPLI